jgi:predicted nucleic acid-binding Zn ribbon protein
MATFDFKCNYCTSIEETNSNIPEACKLCGELMVRVWSPTPTHFKGTGFYKTGG